MASDYAEQVGEGLSSVPYYIHNPLLIIIPLLMLIVAMIRNSFKKRIRRSNQKQRNIYLLYCIPKAFFIADKQLYIK
jgi:hypothetical protein